MLQDYFMTTEPRRGQLLMLILLLETNNSDDAKGVAVDQSSSARGHVMHGKLWFGGANPTEGRCSEATKRVLAVGRGSEPTTALGVDGRAPKLVG